MGGGAWSLVLGGLGVVILLGWGGRWWWLVVVVVGDVDGGDVGRGMGEGWLLLLSGCKGRAWAPWRGLEWAGRAMMPGRLCCGRGAFLIRGRGAVRSFALAFFRGGWYFV